MKSIVELVARSIPLDVEEIDISTNAALEARYGLEIPVLEIEGKKAAKIRVSAEELQRILRARA
jgi:Glutaredoxin-like domain (DUF836)